MNAHFRPPPNAPQPHLFTHEDVLGMIAQGFLDQRVQLLDGEIYDMAHDGSDHITYAMRIARFFMRQLSDDYFIGVQTTLLLSHKNAPSPDMYVLAGGPPKDEQPIPAERILLVIEVADTSLKLNLTDSASRYARHGVRDYWVVDVNARQTHVHRDPADGAYPAPRLLTASEPVKPLLVPGVEIRLADFAPTG